MGVGNVWKLGEQAVAGAMASAWSVSLWRGSRGGAQRGPGAEPLVVGKGAKPPEAKSFLVLERPTERQNFSRCQLVVFRDMVQVYSQNLVSMVRIGCAVRKWIDFLRNEQLDGEYNTSTIDYMTRKCLMLDFFGGIGVIPPIPTSVTVAWSVGPWQ